VRIPGRKYRQLGSGLGLADETGMDDSRAEKGGGSPSESSGASDVTIALHYI
jgi:hypothetical protein